MINLSPAKIKGLGLTLAGFDANWQARTCPATWQSIA
jgi:hypothetical protein